jgi:single-stranded-DNA-specific exonuclease
VSRPTPRIVVPEADVAAELALADQLTVDPAVARLLRARGFHDAAAARAFLFPDVTAVSPPADIPDLPAAAELLVQVARGGERVFVAGDYDVDGLGATALLTLVLRDLGADVVTYIPNRLTEGYDLTDETVARAVAARARVLVTVDCGSRALASVAAARAAGLVVIVTDHHRFGDELPAADVVVSTQRLPEGHPARGLAAVGIAYKLAAAMLERDGGAVKPEGFLPLVALGTICDVVDLVGENRALVAAGLARFPGDRLPGLAALVAAAGLGGKRLRSWHIAFVLGPRLNAAGRLGHAEFALQLLLAEEEATGLQLARRLEEFNQRRRAYEDAVLPEALAQATARYDAGRRLLVCAGEGWHAGVLGIVASRLVERFFRPVVLIGWEGDAGRGSCRSIPPFDIHEALRTVGGRLLRFGGHRQAAGFEIERAEMAAFEAEIESYADEALADVPLTPSFAVDGYLPLGALNEATVAGLELLEPVGQGNAEATFYARAEAADGACRVFKNAHLELYVRAGPSRYRAIGFNFAPAVTPPVEGKVELIYTPTLDSRGGRGEPQLRLKYLGVGIGPGAPEAGSDRAPTFVDRRGRRFTDAAADMDAGVDVIYGLAERAAAAPGAGFLPYMEPGASAAGRRIYVAAPPPGPAYLAALAGAAAELVWAFDDEAVNAALSFLRAYYPDRGGVEALYRSWRAEPARLAEAAADRGAARAVAICEELGLIIRAGNGLTLATVNGRRPLTDSALFVRSDVLRAAAERFVKKLAAWSAAALAALVAEVAAWRLTPSA